jgi:hypothetical protein
MFAEAVADGGMRWDGAESAHCAQIRKSTTTHAKELERLLIVASVEGVPRGLPELQFVLERHGKREDIVRCIARSSHSDETRNPFGFTIDGQRQQSRWQIQPHNASYILNGNGYFFLNGSWEPLSAGIIWRPISMALDFVGKVEKQAGPQAAHARDIMVTARDCCDSHTLLPAIFSLASTA